MLDAGASRRVQLGGAGRDDRVVFGVDRNDRAGLGRRPQEEPVVVTPLDEARRDHEDLESGMTTSRECGDFGACGRARFP